MKKLMSIMLAMMIFAFNAMAAPSNDAATKKAPVHKIYQVTPPAPDLNLQTADFVKADILFKDDTKAWQRKSDLNPDGIYGKASKTEAATNKKAAKEKAIQPAYDINLGINAVGAKTKFYTAVPVIIPLK